MRITRTPLCRFVTGCLFSLLVGVAGCGSSGGGSNSNPDAGSSGSGGKSGGGTSGASGGGGGNSGGGTGGSAIGGKITSNGCAGGTCQNPTCQAMGTPAAIGTSPEIGFETMPTYIPNNMIIPTFDDVPDGATDATDPTYKVYGAGQYTKQILAFLKTNNMHADFFINSDNWCGPVADDDDCVATLTDILTTQNPANHTVHHMHMGGTTVFNAMDLGSSSCGFDATAQVKCEDEITGVESLVNMLTLGSIPHLTRFRAPYGEPYQAGMPNLIPVQQVVSKYAVSVGWQMDSGDSSCDDTLGVPCFTGMQIYNNVVTMVGTAPGQRWGILLMHGTFPWTKDAVPMLLHPTTGYFATHGFKLATVEDVICWKYGKHSWEIIQQLTGQPHTPN